MIPGFNIGFLEVTWIDIADIFLVGILLFQVYKLLRGSIAIKIFIGLLSIYTLYLIVKAAEMELLTTILGEFIGVGVVATLILFQQEIRKFLLMIGKTTSFNNDRIFNGIFRKKGPKARSINLDPIVEAATNLGSTKTGALIVFAKDTELKFYAESGDKIDAVISKRLLISIFNKHSPMHDGAVIISYGKIKAARCILPVSENDEIPAFLGLRHRAAIGMSEVTDSVVLIVSEETGALSIAVNGVLFHNLTPPDALKKLNLLLYEDEDKIKEELADEKPVVGGQTLFQF